MLFQLQGEALLTAKHWATRTPHGAVSTQFTQKTHTAKNNLFASESQGQKKQISPSNLESYLGVTRTEGHDHRIMESWNGLDWEGPQGSFSSRPLPQAGLLSTKSCTRSGCPGPCPNWPWTSLVTEHPQFWWVACSYDIGIFKDGRVLDDECKCCSRKESEEGKVVHKLAKLTL